MTWPLVFFTFLFIEVELIYNFCVNFCYIRDPSYTVYTFFLLIFYSHYGLYLMFIMENNIIPQDIEYTSLCLLQ